MTSVCGKNLRVTIFGQSHSAAIGVTIDGLPAGKKINMDQLNAFLQRRAPGQNDYSTERKEADIPEFVSGLVDGTTCGAPLTAIIRNTDVRSGDYSQFSDIPRPAHVDYAAQAKFGGVQDVAGGGHYSGRLTAPLCIAGGICLQLLGQQGIEIGAHIESIGHIKDEVFDPVNVSLVDFTALKKKSMAVIDDQKAAWMAELILAAKSEGDSIGGVVECAALGIPAGIGEPLFDGLENRIAAIVFGIPAVKGIEFGNGFAASEIRGSENNDSFYYDQALVKTRTNNHGGILGGISSGMPLIFRAAFKPTPSIAKEQQSVSLSRKENTTLEIKGRHDPCIVPRAVACVEAAAAIAIYDAILDTKN